MDDGDMLAVLTRAERALGSANAVGLLNDTAGWNTLDVDYEPPRVERLWREFEDGRLYLHRIHPCEKALYHPHPWPSAVKIITGSYEMGIGYHVWGGRPATWMRVPTSNEIVGAPPYASLQVLTAGCTYEMIRPGGWHYVRPLGGTSYSIMVTGPKWDGLWSPKANHKLNPLSSVAKEEILEAFVQHLW